MERSLEILERDEDAIRLVARGPKGEIEVVVSVTREGDTLILRGRHINGPGPGLLGVAELREFGREFARFYGTRRLLIFGGVRYTGAKPRHVPRSVVIEVN